MPTYVLCVTDAQGNEKRIASGNPDAKLQCRDGCKKISEIQAGEILKFRNADRSPYFEVVDSVEIC